ncbi:MAG TPA: bifunctional UDP-N-acetylglucosamine diphosphorylase/glucosamine-1-phosphate N-acetyltransferase GlmU, partial [bacterium]|nr:bifunctional UDP-N-acetylglucosamine diphosphorylase/glucosamine-1-phosphate N-acetyltransferase GlmU [bacterium]
ALASIKNKEGALLVINGDMPFISTKTLRQHLHHHKKQGSVATLLSRVVEDPVAFGRIVRDAHGRFMGVVESRDASSAIKQIREINVGSYVFELSFLHRHINQLNTSNRQKEYYLPDLFRMAKNNGLVAEAFILRDAVAALGVNSQEDLSTINQIFYERQRRCLMSEGVSLVGKEIYIDFGVRVAKGTVIEAPCYLKGNSSIGEGVTIETGCVIKSSKIAAGTLIKAYSYLDQARVGNHCQVGPFAHLRPKASLRDKAKVGNFVEVKKSVIGQGSKVSHLSYIGDAVIGKKVNVGAGTITCNYDGYHKYKTVLDDEVFIGSDTQLVAPVRVGRGAVVGAGTTVVKNVAADSLVISRCEQKEILGWAVGYRKRNSRSN